MNYYSEVNEASCLSSVCLQVLSRAPRERKFPVLLARAGES